MAEYSETLKQIVKYNHGHDPSSGKFSSSGGAGGGGTSYDAIHNTAARAAVQRARDAANPAPRGGVRRAGGSGGAQKALANMTEHGRIKAFAQGRAHLAGGK